MIDGKGEYLPYDDAYKSLGKLEYPQILEAITALSDSMREVAESAVPPTSDGD